MIGVHFRALDEFLDELELHAQPSLEHGAPKIHRGIVRATPVYRYRNLQAGIRRCSVLASFVSVQGRSLTELVHVDAFAGDLWGHAEKDAEVDERRDALMASIAAACDRLDLELRPGFYEART